MPCQLNIISWIGQVNILICGNFNLSKLPSLLITFYQRFNLILLFFSTKAWDLRQISFISLISLIWSISTYILKQAFYSLIFYRDFIGEMSLILKEEPIIFKVLLVGPSGVGKTSLILKYIKNIFSYDYQITVGVEFFTKTLQINQKQSVKLQIWDTVGQQAFRSVVRSFYKGVSAILLIYSIDNKESFIQLSGWLKEIRQHSHPQTLIFLVGTKIDLHGQQPLRKVNKQEGKKYKNSINADLFMQVSAKTGENVKQLFQKLSKSLVKRYNESSLFKCLVSPLSTVDTPSKAESFNLKYDAVAKRSLIKKQSECC